MTVIKRFDPEEWVTIGTAAELAGVSRDWMRYLVEQGRVEGVNIDGWWFARRSSALAFVRDPLGRGRPPSPKRPRR